jgi:ATP-binding cassette subfamily F protein uup
MRAAPPITILGRVTLLAAKDLEKTYGHEPLLRSVSLVLEDGEHVGLLGRNGSGKSTLLRILAGRETPDAGERTARRGLRLGYLEQEPVLDAALTVREVVRSSLPQRSLVLEELERIHAELASPELTTKRMESLLSSQSRLEDALHLHGGLDVDHRVEALLSNLGIRDPGALCGTLSGGERRRAALAQLLLWSPELLLLDEPTNHLDALAVDWLEDHLLETQTPVLMVTHDRYFLDRVADRILELDRGVLFAYDGGYSEFLEARAARLEAEESAEASRSNILRRESVWMKRGPPARTTKQKARIKRFQQLSAADPIPLPGEMRLTIPTGPKLGNRAIKMTGVRKAFGERTILEDVTLEIGPGTRLGVVGPNGAGKTTFLKIAIGALAPDAGTVEKGPSVVIGAIDQMRSDLDPNKTVLREIAGPNDHVRVGERMVRIETFLDQLLFPGAMKHQLVGKLSGGERNRVLLGKLLCAGGNVLILDEPTNDLDLSTLRALEEALCDFPGAVLVVSHDRYFLDRVATKVLYLDGSGTALLHEGAVSDLLAKRAAAQRGGESARAQARATARDGAPNPKNPDGDDPKNRGGGRKLNYQEKKELAGLPDKIVAAEAALAACDRDLADPQLYAGARGRLAELSRGRREAEESLARLYRRWEELEGGRGAPG